MKSCEKHSMVNDMLRPVLAGIMGSILGYLVTTSFRNDVGSRQSTEETSTSVDPAKPSVIATPQSRRTMRSLLASPPPIRTPDQYAGSDELPADLQQLESVIGQLYGEPTYWDSDQAQEAVEGRLRKGFDALGESGLGELLSLDCSLYPCVGSVATEGSLKELRLALPHHVPDVAAWAFLPKVSIGDGRVVNLLLFEQPTHDMSRVDPYLQMRKLHLEIDATAPPIAPESVEARTPLFPQ
jgi:hypothetical protein